MGRVRVCALCGARLPGRASARRKYCDDVCRSQAYRERRATERVIGLGLVLAEAEWNGDTAVIDMLTCRECGWATFPGGGRRRDALYCSGRCRTRAWRRRKIA